MRQARLIAWYLFIGSLLSIESINVVSGFLQQKSAHLVSIIDVEPFFKTGPPPSPEVVAALTKHILPSINVLSATVPQIKALMDAAGIPVDYPKSVHDVSLMAASARKLGPEYVIIKREFLDAEDKSTTLHYVLSGPAESAVETLRCRNPKGVFGASYSAPRK